MVFDPHPPPAVGVSSKTIPQPTDGVPHCPVPPALVTPQRLPAASMDNPEGMFPSTPLNETNTFSGTSAQAALVNISATNRKVRILQNRIGFFPWLVGIHIS